MTPSRYYILIYIALESRKKLVTSHDWYENKNIGRASAFGEDENKMEAEG